MKDWNGNTKSFYTTLGASNHSELDRVNDDYYATDPSAIDDLFKVEEFSQYIWEPACGEGHLSKRMMELGKSTYSTDLIDRGYGFCDIDFFERAVHDHFKSKRLYYELFLLEESDLEIFKRISLQQYQVFKNEFGRVNKIII